MAAEQVTWNKEIITPSPYSIIWGTAVNHDRYSHREVVFQEHLWLDRRMTHQREYTPSFEQWWGESPFWQSLAVSRRNFESTAITKHNSHLAATDQHTVLSIFDEGIKQVKNRIKTNHEKEEVPVPIESLGDFVGLFLIRITEPENLIAPSITFKVTHWLKEGMMLWR